VRRVLVYVCVVTCVMVGSGGASAFSNGSGNSPGAPGQARAYEQCFAAFLRQYEGGVAAGGGPKHALETGETPGIAPLNCDHFWQGTGAIGNT
jgi:hypothetical protein